MKTVELNAGRIHYVERGEGPAVVLLHGLLMNHTQWDAVIDKLPEGFRYLLPVLPLGSHPEPMRENADLTMRGMISWSRISLPPLTFTTPPWSTPTGAAGCSSPPTAWTSASGG
ncbi:hypothetical protein NS506_06795 [Nocardia seriolae]|uniref:Hydrolase n=1 Tax=Nocardia seriolae TaxID=37332 RepID=A0ABC9Z2S5_9NOCA|nr:hypothetical protein NS506_06795 [Nocardia seriolae]GEM27685.1 hypothetical protein NS2_59240 [Nocardia seriolae NBRC 15557]BEK86129.1 hypothetical protein NSERKGN1266_20800 [Nocardia seriolae]BEK97938.1 hypothetical protein NSER024013_58440 [Nocardia seriolae]GAM50046.1 hydrolase [Nocardia seriolae]